MCFQIGNLAWTFISALKPIGRVGMDPKIWKSYYSIFDMASYDQREEFVTEAVL